MLSVMIVLSGSFFVIRGKFNPGMWDETDPGTREGVAGPKPPMYMEIIEDQKRQLQNMEIWDVDLPPPTFRTGKPPF